MPDIFYFSKEVNMQLPYITFLLIFEEHLCFQQQNVYEMIEDDTEIKAD